MTTTHATRETKTTATAMTMTRSRSAVDQAPLGLTITTTTGATAMMSGTIHGSAPTIAIVMMLAGRSAIATPATVAATLATCSHAASICPADATAKSSTTPVTANTRSAGLRAARWPPSVPFGSCLPAIYETMPSDWATLAESATCLRVSWTPGERQPVRLGGVIVAVGAARIGVRLPAPASGTLRSVLPSLRGRPAST